MKLTKYENPIKLVQNDEGFRVLQMCISTVRYGPQSYSFPWPKYEFSLVAQILYMLHRVGKGFLGYKGNRG